MVAVRHVYNGWLEDVSTEEARRLLRLGLVELAGPLEPETATVAPPETAMLPAAKPKPRGVKRGR